MSSRDLTDFYQETYLNSGTPQNQQPKKEVVRESIEDFDDELLNETYYAGGDEKPRRKKSKAKRATTKKGKVSKESFMSLADSILNEEFEDFGDDGEFDDFDSDSGGEEETVSVSVSVLRDLIDQLQGIVGFEGEDDLDLNDEFVDGEDDFSDDDFETDEFVDDEDPFEGDDFPQESTGDSRMRGDYSGKLNSQKGSNLGDRSRVKTGYRPHNKAGKTGDGRMRGDYSGKPKGDGNGGKLRDKSSSKVGCEPTCDDLF